ncbi:MAG: neutral/alkaline non-lysosomal ceramidase C-terminal domain-containing protein, partial [Deltaproteobacteria bacterium]|nr:neutral/alkaline non-lysosomal ceramidase C-terminal domain-containing protein [Deltaproteobacteria bacterium]
MKLIITLLVCALFLSLSSTGNAGKGKFAIKTLKPVYKAGEKINFDVINQTAKEQSFYVLSAQKLEGRDWVQARIDTAYSCGSRFKKKPLTVGPAASVAQKWNQKTDECEPAAPGTYRIVVLGDWNCKTGQQLYHGYSNK